MKLLRCAGLACAYLSPAALEAEWAAIEGGHCVCLASLDRADRRARLRACGKLRDRRRRLLVSVLVQPLLPGVT
jgi:hypothetical protein